jgi:predicted GH43/DUF377 family glycosyl hydrolase
LSSRLKVILLLTLIAFAAALFQLPSVAHAQSSNEWIKYVGNPVLGPTAGGWDSGFTITPVVLFDGTIYRMWYVGGHATATGIGYANSTDGITWTKYPDPVLLPGPSGSWDSSQIALGSVIWNGTLFLMAYRGVNPTTYSTGAVGVAISRDGISWVKYPGNPVMTPGGVDQDIGRPFVIRWQTTYNMWYSGRSSTEPSSSPARQIFYATSTNGITWTKWPSAVILPSVDPNVWNSGTVYAPSVIRGGSNFGLWYSALNQSGVNPQIGYATSMDGVTWNKAPNPILTFGASGSWDSAGVEQSDVVIGVNGFMLYYDGFNPASPPRIGLAQAPQNFTVPETAMPQLGFLLAVLLSAAVCYAHRKRL